MKQSRTAQLIIFCSLVFFSCARLGASEPETVSLEEQVSGLWLYTGLTTSDGKSLPLNGIFLFKDGVFVQYAAFNGEPVKDQGAMAHAGSYSTGEKSVKLMAAQTISTAPLESKPYSSRGRTDHDISVERSGDKLTLVFGTGTIQEFELAGPGSGKVYMLEHGALALVDGYFIMVSGNDEGTDTGYGSYEKQGDAVTFEITRWTTANPSSASNTYDTNIKASFDGQVLQLDDGRSFQVKR